MFKFVVLASAAETSVTREVLVIVFEDGFVLFEVGVGVFLPAAVAAVVTVAFVTIDELLFGERQKFV